MQEKLCRKCGATKPSSEFYRGYICTLCNNDRINKWRLSNRERDCANKKKWYIENIAKAKVASKKWAVANPEKVLIMQRNWHKANPEKVKTIPSDWRKANPEKYRDLQEKWKRNNPEKLKEQRKQYHAKSRSTVKGKLNNNVSSRINSSLKNKSKANRHWEDLVGYTIEQLKKHLEKRFTPEMTWENYGKVWEIDHKIPVSVFNYERPEDIDFRICWSLKNLQPLEAKENRVKQDKLDKPFQPALLLSTGGIQ